MREAGVLEPAERQEPTVELRLLVARDSWSRNFLQNFREQFRAVEPVSTGADAGEIWADVFVKRGVPWTRFLQSGIYHALAIAVIWAGSRFVALQPRPAPKAEFTHSDVVFYAPAEYLPPLDTRQPAPARRQTSDPEYAAQPIISLPPAADNRSQTIVTPPQIRLRENVAVPNIVSWNEHAALPIAPAPLVPASELTRLAPQIEQAIVAPAPNVAAESTLRDAMKTPEAAVIAPPPQMNVNSIERPGDMNIGPNSVVAPAPELSLDAQRAGSVRGNVQSRAIQVIAPPPSMAAAGATRSGNMIALNLRPAIAPPSAPVEGNRRGSFAATPEGHRGGSGAEASGNGNRNAENSTGTARSNLPSGLYVGKSATTTASVPNSYSVNPKLLATARLPRIAARMHWGNETKLSEEEQAVFGNRKFYSLSLNMPNLNSAAGSWVIRFAALKQDAGESNLDRLASAAAHGSAEEESLSAPSATRKVDPAYPLELMRQNIGGTVILYAVIHRDGTVGGVRVLRSVDERLDRFATQALAKWQFDPAMKNGAPVDVEATFWIPFKPAKTGSGF